MEGDCLDDDDDVAAGADGGEEESSLKPEDVAPQVEVDASGNIIVAQDSLLANPESRVASHLIDAELGGSAAVVDEGESTSNRLGIINSRHDDYRTGEKADCGSGRSRRWGVAETRAFYQALRSCGTDFGMMMMGYFPERTRPQLKRKFKMESRKNARLVDMCLDPKFGTSKLDVTLFGNDLEIPDEVPAFDPVKRADSPGEVKQTDSPLPPSGGNAGIKKNDGEEVENSHERKYDDLFHEEDGSDAGTMAVKEDYGNAKDYMAALQSKHNNAPTPPPSEHQSGKGSGTNGTTSKTIPNGKIGPKKEEQEVPALVPLAPVAPSAKKAKKTRFKVQVRPKKGGIARKSLKMKK
mmetsp:Transcript_624/g.1422  ORF Transcript_624/g.1422 Transcript_624/m.1422 type:complete len:352 (-) Transcript_624:195-1250(-)